MTAYYIVSVLTDNLRAKFTLNSCVGRFGLNLSKHRETKFVKTENLCRHINTSLLDRTRELNGEYDTGIHEVTKKKKHDTDDIAVHISLYVYQLSKLHFFKFIMVLNEYLREESYKLCYMGKT